jgi:hypothetical protein
MPPTRLPKPGAPAIAGCLEACGRCAALIAAIRGVEGPAAERAYAAVGPHLRHCLDHFTCLLRGLDTGQVDYDARDRDAALEREPDRALALLSDVAERLRIIGTGRLDRPLAVLLQAAPDPARSAVPSNLERELMFLSGHTIHHLAIMALLAEREGVAVPQGLDVAFSTSAAWSRLARS